MQSSGLHSIFILAFFFFLAADDASGFKSLPCSEEFLGIDAYAKMNKGVNDTKCKTLSTLQAQFAWNYCRTRRNQTRINVLIGTELITDMGWLAWGVNPDLPQMVGTRAIIAIKMPNQSTPVVNTYNITGDTKLHCKLQPSDIDVKVQNMTAYDNATAGFFTVSATLILPQNYEISSLNHVWQVGHFADGLEPKMHWTSLQNFDSKEILDLETGDSDSVGGHRQHLRKIHGILNIMGWGTLLPIGVIIARYFKQYPFKLQPWWFFFHYCCQALGYTLGTIGWGLGLLLGHESRYYAFHQHRVLGICIFGFTTLQMLAFRFKPTREDEYRKHWNVYHHFLGYSLLVMIPVNIYKGIKILKPDNQIWKWAYNGILVLLAMVVLALEIYTWSKFLYEKYHKIKQSNAIASHSEKAKDEEQPEPGTSENPIPDRDKQRHCNALHAIASHSEKAKDEEQPRQVSSKTDQCTSKNPIPDRDKQCHCNALHASASHSEKAKDEEQPKQVSSKTDQCTSKNPIPDRDKKCHCNTLHAIAGHSEKAKDEEQPKQVSSETDQCTSKNPIPDRDKQCYCNTLHAIASHSEKAKDEEQPKQVSSKTDQCTSKNPIPDRDKKCHCNTLHAIASHSEKAKDEEPPEQVSSETDQGTSKNPIPDRDTQCHCQSFREREGGGTA